VLADGTLKKKEEERTNHRVTEGTEKEHRRRIPTTKITKNTKERTQNKRK
jgi:hypothetical protein